MNPELIRIYYDADTGGAGGAAIDAAAAASDQTAQHGQQGDQGTQQQSQATSKAPKWESQLSPEKREQHKEILTSLGEEYSLNSAIDEIAESRGKLGRSILLPKEGDTEDLKRFMKDMGIPESADGYGLQAGELSKEILTTFQTQALKAGLTKTQAGKMWGYLSTLTKAGQKVVSDAGTKLEATFDARLTQAEGSPEKAQETQNYATKFLIRFGDKELLEGMKQSGIIYNTKFIQKIAAFEKALGDTHFVDDSGTPAGKNSGGEVKGGKMGNYSQDFKDQFGGN